MLPDAAQMMAAELDGQLKQRLQAGEGTLQGVSLITTTPVNINNLKLASPLARLLMEEMASWFVGAGYDVQEIRKGRNVLFSEETGELMLTRDADLLARKDFRSALIMTGTYVVTSKHVRFNIRLIHAGSNNVMAMTSRTIPVSGETLELLQDGSGQNFLALEPRVHTSFSALPQ